LPESNMNPNIQPGYAHKESLIELETADDIKGYIEASGFSSKTKNDLLLILATASGKEFRTANYSLWEGLERKANFRLRMIELEVLIPREDRDRKEFEAARMAIEDLYVNNLSQSIRDEYGRNVFWAQYVEEVRTSSYSETNENAHVTQVNPQQGGFSFSNLPIIGGFVKK
jgi:hypothetical protein